MCFVSSFHILCLIALFNLHNLGFFWYFFLWQSPYLSIKFYSKKLLLLYPSLGFCMRATQWHHQKFGHHVAYNAVAPRQNSMEKYPGVFLKVLLHDLSKVLVSLPHDISMAGMSCWHCTDVSGGVSPTSRLAGTGEWLGKAGFSLPGSGIWQSYPQLGVVIFTVSTTSIFLFCSLVHQHLHR